jgi:ABC-type polysaccharide/polyol phosphate export permease
VEGKGRAAARLRDAIFHLEHHVLMSSTGRLSMTAGRKSATRRRYAAMVGDFSRAFGRYRLAWSLTKEELFSGLEMSRLGLLWLFIQPLLYMLAVLLLLRPAQVEANHSYALYVAIGVVLFHGISTFTTNGARVFTREKGRILNVPLPLSLFVLKNAMLVAMEYVITAPIILATMVFAPPPLSPVMLAVVPGLVIFFAFGIGTTLLLGTLAARIVDLVQVTQAVMRILFFLTPVFWQPDGMRGARHFFATYNPFYYMLAVIREPLMGIMPSRSDYLIAIACASVVLAAGIAVYGRFRERIPVWI